MMDSIDAAITKAQRLVLVLLVLVVGYVGTQMSGGCVATSTGELEFSPEAAYAEASLAITDLEAVRDMFAAQEGKEESVEFITQIIEGLDDFRDVVQVYINGGGEGDALQTSLAALQYLADYQWDDEDYLLYATVLKIALNRIRSYLPELE